MPVGDRQVGLGTSACLVEAELGHEELPRLLRSAVEPDTALERSSRPVGNEVIASYLCGLRFCDGWPIDGGCRMYRVGGDPPDHQKGRRNPEAQPALLRRRLNSGSSGRRRQFRIEI